MHFILLGFILTLSLMQAPCVQEPRTDVASENVDTLNYVSYQGSEAFPTTTNKIEDKWFSEDKLHHFSYSFGITGLTYHIYHCQFHNPKAEARTFSISLASVTGISKEFYDRYCKKKKLSYKDLVADVLGITLATLLFTIY